MAKIPWSNSFRGTTRTLGSTFYAQVGAAPGLDEAAAEDATQVLYVRVAGIFSNLYLRVSASDTSGSTTVTFRKNSANGNQSLSIGAALTGNFEDTTHTDSVVLADLIDYKFVISAGTSTFTCGVLQMMFSATNNTIYIDSLTGGYGLTFTSVTQFDPFVVFGGDLSFTESMAHAIQTTCTIKNFYLDIAANARTTATTFKSRKNGSDGAYAQSVAAGITGVFQDVVNTDSLVEGDRYCLAIVWGSDANVLTPNSWIIGLEATHNDLQVLNLGGFQSINANQTNYGTLTASAWIFFPTENQAQGKIGFAAKLHHFEFYTDVNSLTAATTVRTRINGINGAQSISIGSGATGLFTDATNVDHVVATDLISFQIVAGATGTLLGGVWCGIVKFIKTYGRLLNDERNRWVIT